MRVAQARRSKSWVFLLGNMFQYPFGELSLAFHHKLVSSDLFCPNSLISLVFRKVGVLAGFLELPGVLMDELKVDTRSGDRSRLSIPLTLPLPAFQEVFA